MQKNPGATLRPIFDFGYPGRVALTKHGGALRLHGHHASKQTDRFGRIVERDKATLAKPMKRFFHGPTRS
jgi:hypothetical protein